MNRDELIATLESCRDAIRAEGATALYIYGSRARGDHRPDSDLDVFVEYDPASRFSLLDLAGIYNVISDQTGLKVSITTRDSLHPKLKPEIERQAVRVF
jgi:predicted nucleotidyltransferase